MDELDRLANKFSSPKDSEKPEAKSRDPREKEDPLSHVIDKVKKSPVFGIVQSVLHHLPDVEIRPNEGIPNCLPVYSCDSSSGPYLDNPSEDFPQHMQTEDPAIKQGRGPFLGHDEDDPLNRPPTDKELKVVSEHIGASFHLLGIELGLTNATIEHIRIEYQNHGVRTQIFQMLCAWKEKEGRQATKKKLIDATNVHEGEIDMEKIKSAFNL